MVSLSTTKGIDHMRYIFCLLLALATMFCISWSEQGKKDVKEKIHQASASVQTSANYNAITDSLYKQIRPRADVTNESLSSEVIEDDKVRNYIAEKYTPMLLKNYEQINASLRMANKYFGDCHKPEAIKTGGDVQSSLCMNTENYLIEIRYMNNAYGQEWKIASVF